MALIQHFRKRQVGAVPIAKDGLLSERMVTTRQSPREEQWTRLPVVLGGRAGGNTNTCQPEERTKEGNVAPRRRPVGSICSSQDFAFVQPCNNA